MMRAAKIGGAALAVVILIAAIVVFIAYLRIDADRVVTALQNAVRENTDRELIVEGDVSLVKGWRPRLVARQVSFTDAPWSDRDYMMQAESVDLQVKLTSLIFGPPIILDAKLDQPQIFFEKTEDGVSNWRFGKTPDEEQQTRRENFPAIRQFEMTNASLRYEGAMAGRSLKLVLDDVNSQTGEDGRIRTTAAGTFQGDALEVEFIGAPWGALRNEDVPYPVQIALSLAGITAKANGVANAPLRLRGLDFDFDISGEDLADLFEYTGISLPVTPRYDLAGQLTKSDGLWRYDVSDGIVGGSDLSGEIGFAMRQGKPHMTGDLMSQKLYLADIAGLLGLDPVIFQENFGSKEGAGRTSDPERGYPRGVFSEAKFNLARLQNMNADVTLTATKVLSANDVFDEINADVSLNEGVLRFSPFSFQSGGGNVHIYLTLDASTQRITADVRTEIRDLPMSRFVGDDAADETSGPLTGKIELSTIGDSPAEMIRASNGDLILVMDGGKVSHLLIEIIGLDLMESLGVALSGDEPIDVNCAIAKATATDGVYSLDTLIYDSTDTIITGNGEFDLHTSRADLKLRPAPKDVSPLTFKTMIRVQGPIDDLSIYPDPLHVGSEGFLSRALNTVATPVIGLLPPFDTGSGKDANCRGFLNDARGG